VATATPIRQIVLAFTPARVTFDVQFCMEVHVGAR
jgi:hypothetical protein